MGKGETTRTRILSATAALCNQRGIAGCSLAGIQAAAGLEKGGIYRHFQSKAALTTAATAFAFEQTLHARTRPLPGDAIAQLEAVIHQFCAAPSPFAGGCPLCNVAVEADDRDPRLRAMAADAFAQWRAQLESVIEQGIAHGEIRSGTVPRRLANLLIASLEGAMVISRVQGPATSPVAGSPALETGASEDDSPLADIRASLLAILGQLRA